MDCKAELSFMLARLPQHLPQFNNAQGIHLHHNSLCSYGRT